MLRHPSKLWLPSLSPARGGTESAHRGLWNGLAGLWMPALGPTGATLWDWSGYAHHGALKNMNPGADWVGDRYGWALDFDGIDDYVLVADSPALRIARAGTLWVVFRPATPVQDAFAGLLSKAKAGTLGNWSYGLVWLGSSCVLSGRISDGLAGNVVSCPQPADLDWHQAAFTWDGDALRLYCDGSLAGGPQAQTLSAMVDPAQTLKIGGYAYEGSALGNQEFAGRIAAAGVWSRALTHLEVQTLGASPHVLLRPRCQRWARRFADSPFVARAGQIQVTGQQRGEVCLTGQEVGEAYLTGRAAGLASTSGPAAGQISLAGQIAGEAA